MNAVLISEHLQRGGAYAERDMLLALLAKMATVLGYESWLAPPVETPEPGWSIVLFIRLPNGQVSFHLQDSELAWFAGVSRVQIEPWDRHTTVEKFERVLTCVPGNELLIDRVVANKARQLRYAVADFDHFSQPDTFDEQQRNGAAKDAKEVREDLFSLIDAIDTNAPSAARREALDRAAAMVGGQA
jgi:hypothetical protein